MSVAPALRYVVASLALSVVAVWASENLFWSAPRDGLNLVEFAMTVVMYGICTATCLSAVLMTGITGWRALLLAGALLGWLVEGVIVNTAYDAFPAQLVWTPLAWHALISSLAVLGLCRAGVCWKVSTQIAGLVALGVGGAFWAQYWPLERGEMPGLLPVLGYITGLGVLVPLANIVLDRIGTLEAPPQWVLWTPPAILGVIWLAQSVAAPSPVRLSVPVLLGLTFWIMRRLGSGPAPVAFGPAAPVWRHALFLLGAGLMPVLAVPGWTRIGGMEANLPVALIGGGLALVLWVWLGWTALRTR